jgi:hypothetical protein
MAEFPLARHNMTENIAWRLLKNALLLRVGFNAKTQMIDMTDAPISLTNDGHASAFATPKWLQSQQRRIHARFCLMGEQTRRLILSLLLPLRSATIASGNALFHLREAP